MRKIIDYNTCVTVASKNIESLAIKQRVNFPQHNYEPF